MIYKINNKYYVKVGKDYVAVKVVVKDNDISLEPTTEKLENNGNLKVEPLSFQKNKEVLIKEFSNKKVIIEESEQEERLEIKRNKYSSR